VKQAVFAIISACPLALLAVAQAHPTAGRVLLTVCEVDGKAFPCEKLTVRLTNGEVTVTPERFHDAAGLQGFIVPPEFRKTDYFGVIIGATNGGFSLAHLNSGFLGGKWRVVIDHKPFQEEWRSLVRRKQRCLGVIHFQLGEPETMVSTTCH
jgi:hypothetical protein